MAEEVQRMVQVRVAKLGAPIHQTDIMVGTPLSEVLALTKMTTADCDIRVNGLTVTDFETPIAEDATITLIPRIRGGN